ncbi:MAG TPA: Ig-like domain-containing protein [Longimicrobiales bacterium]|nr:Ig-like domain-containing protein [Longimicrobiales bacterium]
MTAVALLALALAQASPQQGLTVDPAAVEVPVDATARLSLRGHDAADTAAVTWVSTDPAIATVDRTGVVTALRPGTVRVLALAGGRSAWATVTVPALPPARIDVRLPVADVLTGLGAPVAAVVLDRQGNPVPAPDLRFSTASPRIATVDETGRVYGHAPGVTTVRVEAAGASGEAEVRVKANPVRDYALSPARPRVRTGDVVRFRLAGLDGRGRDVGPLLPAWSIDRGGAAVEAEGADGVFVAEEPGRYVVTAYLGPDVIRRAIVEVAERRAEGELVALGHGLTVGHHAGDTWAFEGVDGRDYAYIGTFHHDWMKVFDITDPASPVLTDSLQLDARRINDVKIHPNNRLAIVTREGASSRRNGIVLLDLSTPAHPTILSEYTETVTGGVHNVWIRGDHDLVYAAHNGTSEMHIIDISNPRAPREVGRWGLDKPVKTLHDVIVQEGYAYLSYWDDGAIMLDVGAGTHGGTPTRPTFVSQFRYPEGNTHVAWRHGKYLFLGDEIFPEDWDPTRPIQARGFVHVVDYSDPENPVQVARYEVPEAGVHNLWTDGDRLYAGYYQAGLRVVDIAGELRGDLYRQGRELGALLTSSPDAIVPNWSMTWGAQLFKGNIITADLFSGLWVAKYEERKTVF